MSVPVALPAALAYGLADFTGGLAARRVPVLAVTAVSQGAGLLALLPALALVGGTPSAAAFGLGALAGMAGASGVLLYLRGLAVGPMGVVAPLSAVVGAGIPLLVGVLGGERPNGSALLGIGVALVAILLATAGSRTDVAAVRGLALGLGSGVGFGLFFIGLDATPVDSGLWPLLAGRATSVTLLAALLLTRRRDGVGGGAWGLILFSGVLDTTANVLFLLSTRMGDLGVSAMVVSLYPVVVVLLARLVLRERLTGLQLTSAGLALGASLMLAIS